MTLVTKHNFDDILEEFKDPGVYGFDTETYGTRFSDRLFSLILSNEKDNYYFNFYEGADHLGRHPPEENILPKEWLQAYFQRILSVQESVWCAHNALFDMEKLGLEGLEIEGQVHCTMVGERLLNNTHFKYSLDMCAKRRGLSKDNTVEEYIIKHKLYDTYTVPGKKKKEKIKYFYLVPFNIMVPYGSHDAYLHRVIGMDQLEKLCKSF